MEGEVKSSVDSVISEEVNGSDIGHVHAELRFHRMSWSFILIHRTVRDMMEDQVMISICMVMKGM